MLPTWTTVATVWASVEPLSVRDLIAAKATQTEVTARIKMRKRPIDSKTQRILHDGKIYDIKGDLPDSKSGHEYITLTVSEGVNLG